LRFEEFRAGAGKQKYTNYMAMCFSKVSIRLSYVLVHTSITPNQVTLISTAVGFCGAAMLGYPSYWIRILGVAVWFVAFVLDFCDGEIARYKDMKSDYGHWLDSVTDRAKDLVLFTAITTQTFWQTRAPWVLWVGLLALGGTLLHAYAISYGYKATERSAPGGPLTKFGQMHYALLAVFAVLNYLQIYLLIVALTSLGDVAVNIYISWKTNAERSK